MYLAVLSERGSQFGLVCVRWHRPDVNHTFVVAVQHIAVVLESQLALPLCCLGRDWLEALQSVVHRGQPLARSGQRVIVVEHRNHQIVRARACSSATAALLVGIPIP